MDERCGGVCAYIDEVIPKAERNEIMARYKQAAGFAMEALNEVAPTIAARAGGLGADSSFVYSRRSGAARLEVFLGPGEQ
ncbi:hypothetical protein [Curvibacter sp. PAE-UM]|uniref:hypothetical protein n=1 Tax=Curvibacter sp. PAE-UM TaxID=1714344 RepID=UPI00070ACACB|nr:hypothetical protein [Curvibacter sp. PAE-UM]KRI00160.1 hypothetical protein AO057_15220 [Curvibacter sp. PAE-UM]